MSLRLPLLIGISGKRLFDKDDATGASKDDGISRWVADRFKKIFETLDDRCPETPKIVLTGAAFGTDMIAAEAALAMRADSRNPESWAVVAILPFERMLFDEDFRQAPDDPRGPGWSERFQTHARKFQDLMARAKAEEGQRYPSVIVRELPRLAINAVCDDPDGRAVTMDQVSRAKNGSSALRNNHYEQVGQFIAESATIMIAVMPGDGPADQETANGGTARVVAYRRAGRADEIGTDVARHSTVLRSEWSDLVAPPAAFVWLIDTDDYPGISSDDYPVKVLPPLLDRSAQAAYADEPARAMPKPQHGQISWIDIPRARQLRASLVLAGALETFHADIRDGELVIADVAPADNLPHEAAKVRELVNTIQVVTNKTSRRAFGWLAALFVTAILVFELQVKFKELNPWALGGYLLVLASIWAVVFVARRGRWQAISDDYRAVAEMLRVQEAWWSAGIRERVDREHLQDADPSLARIRDVSTTLIAWLVMRRGWSAPLQTHWTSVIKDWIGGQVDYFSKKAEAREDTVRRDDAVSWTLFLASGFLALIIFIWLAEARWWHSHAFFRVFEHAADAFKSSVPHASLRGLLNITVWLAAAAVLLWGRAKLRKAERGAATTLTILFGSATAVCIALATVSTVFAVGDHSTLALEEELQLLSKSLVSIWLVVLSAAAGAWRYRTERLNIEAEAHEYADAHQRFERAKQALDLDSGGMPKNPAKAYAIVHELGRLALAENEAWLKSRRERPLTPVVG